MASAFYLGKRFTIDPARLDAALSGAEGHFALYREISEEEQALRKERMRMSTAARRKIEDGRISEHVIDPNGGRALRDPLPEEVSIYRLDDQIAKLVARKAVAAEAVQAHGRIADAAREHAQKAGALARPVVPKGAGYIE